MCILFTGNILYAQNNTPKTPISLPFAARSHKTSSFVMRLMKTYSVIVFALYTISKILNSYCL